MSLGGIGSAGAAGAGAAASSNAIGRHDELAKEYDALRAKTDKRVAAPAQRRDHLLTFVR
jgi:hypothetical protein